MCKFFFRTKSEIRNENKKKIKKEPPVNVKGNFFFSYKV